MAQLRKGTVWKSGAFEQIFLKVEARTCSPDAQRVTAAVNRITLMLLQALPE
jgi:hypothetical protein